MGNIVFLASYPKSGNTWLRLFLLNLYSDSDEPVPLDLVSERTTADNTEIWYTKVDKRDPASWTLADIARLRHDVQRYIAAQTPDTAFVKTHAALAPMAGLPPLAPEVTLGAICIVRNPLDIAPSYARHSAIPIDNIINVMERADYVPPRAKGVLPYLQGGWSQNVASWTREKNRRIHVLRYEDMVTQPRSVFGSVARFLGLDIAPERLERAIANSDINLLRTMEARDGFAERPDETTPFFGGGGVDAWRRDLSEAQARRIVARHRVQMARFGYLPDGW